MKKIILNKVMNFIDNGTYSKNDLEKIKYGLECIYIFISKGIVIFTISYLLGLLKYTTIFLLFYSPLRMFACGIHAKNSIACLITSALLFVIIPFVCKISIIPFYIHMIIIIISAILLIIYAPADTEKRPMINKKRRLKAKMKTTIVSIIYIALMFYVKKSFILNSILFSTLLEAIMILPITYKIFGLPYRNYINYLKVHNMEGGI